MKLRVLGYLTLVAVPLALCLAVGAASPQAPKLRILSDQPLPPALGKAVDIRWASDSSVYLALAREGSVEVALSPLGKKVREVIRGSQKAGGFWGSSRLGVSEDFFAVAAPLQSITWIPRGAGSLRKERGGFDFIEDIDVGGKRLLVLGARRGENGTLAPEGGIAWLASLDKNLEDLRPVLFDRLGPGAVSLANCGNFELGAVRFLSNDSFVVFPGVQPGMHLFDGSGKLLRTWDTVAWGFEAECSQVSWEEARKITLPRQRFAWLNQRQILDDILPMKEGLGLIVRQVVQGRVRWQLKHISLVGGRDRAYDLPIPQQNERAHLRGDIREGKLVFLMHAHEEDLMSSADPRLAVVEAPTDL